MDYSPDYGSNLLPERPATAAWNPLVIALIAVFINLWPAGIFHALNFDRLGIPRLKTPRLIQYSLVGVISILFSLMLSAAPRPRPPVYLPMIANLAFGWYYYKSQWPLYEKHLAAGGQKASAAYPLLVGLLFAVAAVGIAMVYGFFAESPSK